MDRRRLMGSHADPTMLDPLRWTNSPSRLRNRRVRGAAASRGRGFRRTRQHGVDAARRPLGATARRVAWGLTVDHGLRPESAAEAGTVAGLARRPRHSARDPALGGRRSRPAASRKRRARRATGCSPDGAAPMASCTCLTAHHREDQIETHLIRRRAGSGPDGLAAMSAVRELPGCRLVRPLLAVPRARLAALLAAEGQPFLDDPSNANPAFERARLRLSSVDQSYGARRRLPAGSRLEAGDPSFVSGFAAARAAGTTSPRI